MKTKIKDITKMTDADLEKKLHEARVKLRELRFSIANNQLKQIRDVRQTRATIARILTVLNQRSRKGSETKEKETTNEAKA